MATGNANFDTLLSTTLNLHRKKLVDNVFTHRALAWWLKSKGRLRMESGGVKIVEPLIYGENSTVASYSGYDPIALTPQTGLTAAEYDWKQLAGSIAISGIEEAKNNGEAAVLNLLRAKIMQTEETLQQKLNEMFFADGTGNSSKDWNGLENLISAAVDAGNISYTDNTWWRSTVTGSIAQLALADLTTLYNTISRGNDHPDFIMTTQTLFERYESLLIGSVRYTDTDTANSGFQNLMFKQAPMVFDVDCGSGIVYMLNSKYIQLVGHSDRWFEQTPFIRPENMDARYALITAYGNLTCSNRARLGKLTDATA